MQRVQLNRIIKKSIIARTIKSYITKAYACGNNDYNRLGFDDNRSKQVFARIPFFLDTKKKELRSDFETDWNKESGKEKFAFDEIKEIKAGGANTFLLSARGKVYVVGLNEYGQCGVAANDDGNDCVKEFTEVIFDEQVLVERIITSAQSSHSIAIAKNGKVFSFGKNEFGQLGVGDFRERSRPCEISVLYDDDDDDDDDYGLKSEEPRTRETPRQVKFVDGATTRDMSLLVTDKGDVYVAGNDKGEDWKDVHWFFKIPSHILLILARKIIPTLTLDWQKKQFLSIEKNLSYYIKPPAPKNQFKRLRRVRGIKKVSALDIKAPWIHGLDLRGDVWALRMFTGTDSDYVNFDEWLKGALKKEKINESMQCADIASGYDFELYCSKHSGSLYISGASLDEQEVVKNKLSISDPLRPVKHCSSLRFTQVAAGYKHAAAITDDHRLFTWGWSGSVGQHFDDGDSSHGQLGLGNDFDYPTPTEVKWIDPRTKVLQVSCGFNHTVVLVQEPSEDDDDDDDNNNNNNINI